MKLQVLHKDSILEASKDCKVSVDEYECDEFYLSVEMYREDEFRFILPNDEVITISRLNIMKNSVSIMKRFSSIYDTQPTNTYEILEWRVIS